MSTLERRFDPVTLAIVSGAAVTGGVDVRHVAGIDVLIPGTWTAATVGVLKCDTATGTFRQAYYYTEAGVKTRIQVGTAADKPLANEWHTIPAQLFPAGYIQLQSEDGSGNAVNQAGDRALVLAMKS
jgi:hypothetical protein